MSWSFAYRSACETEKVAPRPDLENEVEPQTLQLNGNCPERFTSRVDDKEISVLSRAISAVNSVLVVDLSYNNIGDDGAVAFADVLRRNTTIQQLNLSFNNISSQGARAIADALMLNMTLGALSLRGNCIDDSGGAALGTMLRGNNTIASLDLGNCGLQTKALMSIVLALVAHPALMSLKIDKPRLVGPQELLTVVQHLANMVRRNSTLAELALDRFGLTDEHLATLLPPLVANESIVSLTLSGNKLGTDSGGLLAKLLGRRPDLLNLDLTGNQIGDGAVELAPAVRAHPTLEVLAVGTNGIGDRGLCALASACAAARGLQQLTVWGNRFTEASSQAFHNAKPGLGKLQFIDIEWYDVDGEPMICQRNE